MSRLASSLVIPLAFGLVCARSSHAAGPLPQGGAFVAGQGAISSSAATLTVTQPVMSPRGVIDWRSFSIGRGNTVVFNNGSGATLNRVTGEDRSLILGKLTATGSVYLLNPQGVVIGPTGVVTTGGRFVASTLDMCNDTFMTGGPLTLSGTSTANVVNLGHIGSTGGDVFLIARRSVKNDGRIDAPQGTVELAAGQQVLLQDSSGSRQVFVEAGSGGTVRDAGSIRAAQVSLQAADGNVYALASHSGAIRATGTATRDGHVWLVAEQGTVHLLGRIAAADVDGAGGTVETAAAKMLFGRRGHDVPTVLAGLWKVSTPSLTIDRAAAGALTRSLDRGTSIDVATTGESGEHGDLNVASNVFWRGDASLTLEAYRDVNIEYGATLKNTGRGNLTLRADASGADDGASVRNEGVVDWSRSTGTVSALYDMTGSYTAGTMRGNTAWTVPPESGLVTQITAYKLINSLQDLQNISRDLAGSYALGKDIDARTTPSSPYSSVAYVPIGNGTTPFSGQFDGLGHTIDNMAGAGAVPYGYLPASGLFGVIGRSGVVRNVGLTNATGGVYLNDGYDGILAGVNEGTIAHAYSIGSASADAVIDQPIVGGLVGFNLGTITRSWSSVSVGGDGGGVGGLVGYNGDSGVIRQSFASGSVSGFGHSAPGGLVAFNSGLVTQSYATGSVTTSSSCYFCGSGGAALVQTNSGTIEQSFATGAVVQLSPNTPAVGIAFYSGYPTGVIANNVYWDRDTTHATVGGGTLPAANGLTTAQMSNPASFDTSWDFSSAGAWAMPVGATHPVLRWQLTP